MVLDYCAGLAVLDKTTNTQRRAQRRSRARARLDWYLFQKGYKQLTVPQLRKLHWTLSSHHSRDPGLVLRISKVIMTKMEKESWRCGWCWRLCKQSHQRCPDCGTYWEERDTTYVHQARGGASPRRRNQRWDEEEATTWSSWTTQWPSQQPQRPKSPRRSQSRSRKGKGKGKGKAKAPYAVQEPQFGPAALGIHHPAPPWQPTHATTSTTAMSTAPAAPAALGDAQLRGFLNEMKKIPDMPADAHTIIRKYAKKQRSATTKTMHQSVTDLSEARGALDQARLARHQLHGSWRTFLGEALETWQAYTEGFKQQEAALLARIEDAQQNLHAAKEVFEECRSALIDLSKSDQELIESAEAAMVNEQVDDPTVARLQEDLESMHGHLTALKSSADAMAVDSNVSAKRPRLAETKDPTGEVAAGVPSAPGPLEPFGSARK